MQERELGYIIPRLMGANELSKYLSLGKTNAIKFGKSCGALRRIGKRVVYDREVIDTAIEQLTD